MDTIEVGSNNLNEPHNVCIFDRSIKLDNVKNEKKRQLCMDCF